MPTAPTTRPLQPTPRGRGIGSWLATLALLLQVLWLPFHLATVPHLRPDGGLASGGLASGGRASGGRASGGTPSVDARPTTVRAAGMQVAEMQDGGTQDAAMQDAAMQDAAAALGDESPAPVEPHSVLDHQDPQHHRFENDGDDGRDVDHELRPALPPAAVCIAPGAPRAPPRTDVPTLVPIARAGHPSPAAPRAPPAA